MKYTTLFFDLDETLYPKGTGLWDAIADKMNEYIHLRFNMPFEEVHQLRRHYYETYGTTLRGLQIHHQVDTDEYLAFVHDLPLADYIQPDPELPNLIHSLPQKKWVFTNADAKHAKRVLNTLELSDCFEGIVDVTAMDFLCKPDVEAFHRALTLAGEIQPKNCVLLDDSPYNLATAKDLGFTTVLVGSNGTHPAAHYNINRIHDLPQALPALWPDR